MSRQPQQQVSPGLLTLLQALETGGQPQGNIVNLPPIFTQLGNPVQQPPLSPGMQQLQSPFAP